MHCIIRERILSLFSVYICRVKPVGVNARGFYIARKVRIYCLNLAVLGKVKIRVTRIFMGWV